MADRSLFDRLKRIFSTNVIVTNVRGRLKVSDTQRMQSSGEMITNFMKGQKFGGFHSTAGRYGYNELSTVTLQRHTLFRDYELMEQDPIIACLAEDTRVSTLEGFFTMKELSEKYPNGEHFDIWSWDTNECKYVVGQAHHPRKTGTKKVIKLILDNGNFLECTEDHRIMLIDGTYKQAGQLDVNDSIMPFYYKNKEYMMISDRHGKYKKVHRYIYENVLEKDISDKHIHHINHNKYDNRLLNLVDVDPGVHMEYHGISKITCQKKSEGWSNVKRLEASNRMKKLWKNNEYRKQYLSGLEEYSNRHDYTELQSENMKNVWNNYTDEERTTVLSGLREWQNSDEGREFMSKHSTKLNMDRWKNDDEYALKMSKIFSNHLTKLWSNPEWKEYKRKLHSKTMKLKYQNDPDLKNRTKRVGIENGRFNNDITNEFILSEGIKYDTLRDFTKCDEFKNINNKGQFILRRLKSLGYKSYNDYKENYVYQNHKIIDIIYENKVVDVYDLTVDFFENFCLECGIVVSNSALDIYADESTVQNEFGDILTIKSNNSEIKETLDNLFYDILNINFNLWAWSRNMCKYGDHYLKLDIAEQYGIVNVIPMSPYEMVREEGYNQDNPFEVRFRQEGISSQISEFENYEVAHFRLTGDSNYLPYGKCLSLNTKIDTEFGSRMINELDVSDKVWTFNTDNHTMELSNIKKIVCSGEKEILRISTMHNFIDSSFNHPILVYDVDSDSFIYKKSEDIKIGDLLVIDSLNNRNNLEYTLDKKLPEQKSDGPKLDYDIVNNLPNIADEEFAEFIGFMIGDGWLGEYDYGHYSIKFALGMNENLNNKYINILKKYSGKTPDVQRFKGNSRAAIVYSKVLHYILKNNGLDGNSHTKRIPQWIYESGDNIKLAFVKGLTNADGWFTDDGYTGRNSIALCNKKLILDFKRLIQMLNIKSSIPVSDIKNDIIEICGNQCNRTESHMFNYYMNGKKTEQLKKYKKFESDQIYLEPVRNIEFMGTEETWDIQVESKYSNFVANGIVVHNSMLEAARRVWKQLTLMEDAMLIHRIMRAPEKRVFKIDVGNIQPNEVEQYMKSVIDKIKKVPYIDPQTGEYNLKYNMMNITEDFFLPVRGGDSGTGIEPLGGLEYNAIEDIEYLRDKMMAALRIPRAFLGYEEGLCVVPETKIPLIDGTEKTVEELILDYENGIENYVYSINEETHDIVPGRISWAGWTRKNAKLVRVYLDNNEYIDCTPDHNFMTRDGEWVEAQDLKENQSLMPIYFSKTEQINKKGYTTVYNPGTKKYVEVHRLVAEHYNMITPGSGKVVHHKDFNKINNYPSNLDCNMDFWQHRTFHQNLKKGQKNGEIKHCLECNVEFYSYSYRSDESKFCSTECYYNSMRTGKIKKCKICNAEFYNPTYLDRKYCSSECSNSDLEPDRFRNTKYNKIKLNELLIAAIESKSFKDLRYKLNLSDIKTLYKVFKMYSIDKIDFIINHMPLAMKNNNFISRYNIKNHKVIKVEFLNENRDTCDIKVENYHNFATSAGVIIHNSGKATLAAEDVRFAKTIERIQKIMIGELNNLAMIHLYVQGYSEEDMTNFELELTNPSTIAEQEKISIWSEKTNLIRDMKELNMVSDDWIYKNVLNLTDEEVKEEREKLLDDIKRKFRYAQIENEGNDPFKTGQTFGTPHDMALIQKGYSQLDDKGVDFGDNNFKFPSAYNIDNDDKMKNSHDESDYQKDYNKNKRKETDSKYNTDSHVRGRDNLGRQNLKYDRKLDKASVNSLQKYKGKNASIIMESLQLSKYSKNEEFEKENEENIEESSFLSEKNLLDE